MIRFIYGIFSSGFSKLDIFYLNVLYLRQFSPHQNISKKKMESLGLTEYLMKKYAGKETASQYRDLDNTGLIAELSNRLENKAMSVIDQVKFEKEYLQYVVYVNPKVNQCFYVVTDYKTFKEVRKPYCVLLHIHQVYFQVHLFPAMFHSHIFFSFSL